MPLIVRLLCILCCVVPECSTAWNLPFNQHKPPTITLMLDPAGDAQHTGRQLDGNFERGITLQCAERIKTTLEQRHPHVRVVITRSPGEALEPLHNANFANRLNVDCYISLHLYQETATKPRLYIYYFCDGDDLIGKKQELAFYPYDKAHLLTMPTTKKYSSALQHALSQTHLIDVQGVFKLPFKPLIGIKAPALAIEIGLQSKDTWPSYSTVLADGLSAIIEQLS